MAHLGEANLKALTKISTGMRPLPKGCFCAPCIKARLKETPHNRQIAPGRYPLELIHIDIAGPFAVTGYKGARYWVTMVDDKTGRTKATPVRVKDKLPDAVFTWLDQQERPERRCHRIRLDQAGENTSDAFTIECASRGIELELTATDQHQQNGVAEVTNRIILERTYAVLSDSKLPLFYWPFIVESVAYLRDRSPHRRHGVTPYEAWFHEKLDLAHIRKLGSRCMAQVEGQRRKLVNDKSIPCRLLGYNRSRNYILLKDNRQVIRSTNMVFYKEFSAKLCPSQHYESGNNPA
jgi:hypothetical protein